MDPPVHTQVDVSELEERHRQQLQELEEAMKSTWEEKSRVSEVYERERRRMEAEQREAAGRLQQQVREKWRVLEEQRDLDLTAGQLKECAKALYPEAAPHAASWQQRLKDLLKQESDLQELDTVIAVYRASILNDERSTTTRGGLPGAQGDAAAAVSHKEKIAR
jgi:hypothetical protein